MGGCLFALANIIVWISVSMLFGFLLFRVIVMEHAPIFAICVGLVLGVCGGIAFFRSMHGQHPIAKRRTAALLPAGWQWAAIAIGGPICYRLLRDLLPPAWYQASLIGLSVSMITVALYFFVISVLGGWLSLTDA